MKTNWVKVIVYGLAVLVAIWVIISFSSCATEKRCYKKHPPQIEIRDSVVYKNIEIIIHDTVFIYGDTVTLSDTVYINSVTGLITSNRLMSETEYAKAWAQVIDSKLFLELIQNDTAIARMLKENIEIKEVFRTRTKIIKEPCSKKHMKWYHTFALYTAIPIWIIIMILLIWFVIKKVWPILKVLI